MEVIRYKIKYIFLLALIYHYAISENISSKSKTTEKSANCPFSKIIEDIFKMHNKSDKVSRLNDSERAKLFLNSMANGTVETNANRSLEEKLVDGIIASINMIKNNITSHKHENKLNEAIILNKPKVNIKNITNRRNDNDEVTVRNEKIKSGIEDKHDVNKPNDINEISTTTETTKYVEILTIEPNNTLAQNTSSHNILDILKHLMPMFNSTLTKELHNITIIERNQNRNHSFVETKNISTIVVTFCDKDNLTKANVSTNFAEDTVLKIPIDKEFANVNEDWMDLEEDGDETKPENLTTEEKKDLMEAAEYGMQKMHELYSVLEPKLYSMGLWLDDSNPARYVAAFNAPAEDTARFYRYGYASLQAASKLKQLTGGSEDGAEGRTEEAQFPASVLRQSPLMQHCPLKGAPKCPPASKRYRTHDGTCNNLNRPRWGSTMTPVQRFLPPSYSDGIQAPRRSVTGSLLPSAREISSLIHEDKHEENTGITHLLMQWGQFLDHDVTSSSQSRGFNGSVPRCCKDGGKDFIPKDLMHPECFPITVPASDPFYGPRGVRCLDFVRSSPAPRDDCALGWREQLNQVSAYIDASPLYASSARQSDKLRLFRNGMLQYGRVQQRRPILPPERKDELCRGGAVSTDCFKSGDARVNEHPGLVAAHIVWLRQHNRMAQELAHLNPHWSDEKIYQETRKIVGAMVQHITYKEFLPIVLGTEVLRLFDLDLLKKGFYKGYNPKINPSPASSFGSAAFRFGHSLVQSSMVRFDRFHRPLNNNVSLHNELTNPSNIWSMGAVDRLLLGMVNQPIQKRDEFITEELTNHLFQTPSFSFGMDLAAINIQRGRDHGIAPYAAWREPCGLSAVNDFDDLFRIMPARVVRKIKALYRNVEDIDLFTGGISERPVVGGLVGPTFACIIAQQFSNFRKGDRFWYENGGLESSFTPAQLQQIRRISFAQVLCRTLDNIDDIQPFAFLSSDNPDNERLSCHNGLLNNFDLSPWVEIDSNSDNDISKSDVEDRPSSTSKPKKPQTTTTIKPKITTTSKVTTKTPSTTKKPIRKPIQGAASNSVTQKRPLLNSTNTGTVTKENMTNKLNKTDLTNKNKTMTHISSVRPIQNIDDKLDFKNKSRRYDNIDRIDINYKNPTKQYNDYDDEEDDDVQSVQSVVINNLSQKRPYNRPRPVLSVTENVNRFTYLINYVPRSTQQPWRQTTRKSLDRDVVKVTYQTYDDTYRRPYHPYYYNRQGDMDNYNSYRQNRPEHATSLDNTHSAARSNDDDTFGIKTLDKTDRKTDDTISSTDSVPRLVTFGYIGTYRGNSDYLINNRHTSDKDKSDTKDGHDNISKDFSTYDSKIHDKLSDQTDKTSTMKLSTFYHYETATAPYKLDRPTRLNDDDIESKTNNGKIKYYYIKNVLHKYDDESKLTEKLTNVQTDHTNKPKEVDIHERSSPNKMAFLDEIDGKSANPERLKVKIKKPSSSAKTPSVDFQVIPSEISPTQWAVYEEKSDLPDGLPHQMPSVKTDPYALKEMPRPMTFSSLKRRLPFGF